MAFPGLFQMKPVLTNVSHFRIKSFKGQTFEDCWSRIFSQAGRSTRG